MSLFADQLKTLIATLEAVQEKKSFDMKTWHYQAARNVVDCGYVACICGHQAVAKDSSVFEGASSCGFTFRAQEIAESLDESCHGVFKNSYLASSIYEGEEYNRVNAAYMSCLFTHAQLKHPHLTKEKPTIKQAISFIKLALKKVQAVKCPL
jgi:hypothetical protein